MGEWLETPQRKSRKLAVPGLGGSPSGNPNGILPQSPGLRRRGATLGKGQRHKQPQRGCADGSNGWHVRCVYFVDIGHSFRVDSSSALVNLISFRPCFPHPPAGTNGTTPCGVGNPMWPGPGVVRRPAQPRAVWHNVVDVGGGEPRMGVDGRGWAWMGVDGRGPISPSGNA